MRAWPKAFEHDYQLRTAFVSACEAIAIYGTKRENWSVSLDKATADLVWNTAVQLLKEVD